MKTLNLLQIALLMVLASCGGKQAQTTITVSGNSIQALNTQYDGGLILIGKNLSNSDSFSQSLTWDAGASQTSVTLQLSAGNWDFAVVAWDGGTPGENFKGAPYCDHVVFNVNSNTSLALIPSMAKCYMDNFFASPSNIFSTSLKNLQIVTCGLLAENIAIPYASATPSNYCGGLPSVYHSPIHSFKIIALNKINNSTSPGIESPCIQDLDSPADGVFDGLMDTGTDQFYLPWKNFGFRIELYDNRWCDDTYGAFLTYNFPNGLETPQYGAALVADNGLAINNRLFLSASYGKAPDSPFNTNNVIPNIRSCGGPDCFPVANIGVSTLSPMRSFIPDYTGPIQIGVPSFGYDCSSISFTSIGTNIDAIAPTLASGYDGDRNDLCVVNVNQDSVGACTSGGINCRFTYSFTDPENSSAYVREVNTYPGPLVETLNEVYDVLGALPANGQEFVATQSFRPFYNNDRNRLMGLLGDVRDQLSTSGPAALFGGNCSTALGTQNITYILDGLPQTIQVTVTNSSTTIPANLKGASSPTTFEKKIVVKNLPSYAVESITYLHCSYPIGALEVHRNDVNNLGTGEIEKDLYFWNTDIASAKLVQKFSLRKKMLNAGVQYASTRFIEFRNTAANANKFIITKNEFWSQWDGSMFQQNLRQSAMGVDRTMNTGANSYLFKFEWNASHSHASNYISIFSNQASTDFDGGSVFDINQGYLFSGAGSWSTSAFSSHPYSSGQVTSTCISVPNTNNTDIASYAVEASNIYCNQSTGPYSTASMGTKPVNIFTAPNFDFELNKMNPTTFNTLFRADASFNNGSMILIDPP